MPLVASPGLVRAASVPLSCASSAPSPSHQLPWQMASTRSSRVPIAPQIDLKGPRLVPKSCPRLLLGALESDLRYGPPIWPRRAGASLLGQCILSTLTDLDSGFHPSPGCMPCPRRLHVWGDRRCCTRPARLSSFVEPGCLPRPNPMTFSRDSTPVIPFAMGRTRGRVGEARTELPLAATVLPASHASHLASRSETQHGNGDGGKDGDERRSRCPNATRRRHSERLIQLVQSLNSAVVSVCVHACELPTVFA